MFIKMILQTLLVTTLFIPHAPICALTTVSTQPIDEHNTLITLNLELEPNECVYKDYIDFSIDNPNIELIGWESATDAQNQYDLTFKENKKVYKDKVVLTLKAHQTDASAQTANVHFSYYRTRDKAITQEVIPVAFNSPSKPATPELGYAVEAQNTEITESTSQPAAQPQQQKQAPVAHKTWSAYISDIVKNSDSLFVRLLLVFLLGIFMSLTPCIYPMIPITIGVLQSQGHRSFARNFLTALSYVAGIAVTFSLLGLLAAFTGQVFGTIMSHPITILVIVALLIYLGLSMIGLYEMYVPRAFASSQSSLKNGTLVSAFIFGALSGTVASPCISPGLLLLLSIVTTLGSKVIGFALLFTFGLGLGLPLLIIGTFSGALQLLPRAGMWMVEIKRLFGFVELGMCFYFLSTLVPACILLWALAAFVGGVGIFYLYDMHRTHGKTAQKIKTLLGIVLVAASVVIATYAFKAVCMSKEPSCEYFWQTDYPHAVAQARKENKKLFIYFGAKFCSICTAIEKTVFKNNDVCQALQPCVIVKVDGTDGSEPVFAALQKKYSIMGFPTYLLIDPVQDKLIKRWGSELYDTKPELFAQELTSLLL